MRAYSPLRVIRPLISGSSVLTVARTPDARKQAPADNRLTHLHACVCKFDVGHSSNVMFLRTRCFQQLSIFAGAHAVADPRGAERINGLVHVREARVRSRLRRREL